MLPPMLVVEVIESVSFIHVHAYVLVYMYIYRSYVFRTCADMDDKKSLTWRMREVHKSSGIFIVIVNFS